MCHRCFRGHLYLAKHKPDHRASGYSPRRARPFGRAIEVFVASRDDDADYRNAVAQNASLHVVFPQETPFTLTSRPIRPIRNLLNLQLATRSKLFSIECPRVQMERSWDHHRMLMHTLAITFCRMLGCNAETSPICSQCCADFLRMSSTRDPLCEASLLPKKPVPAFAYVDVSDVLGFGIDRFAPRTAGSRMNQGRNPE